MSEPIDYLKPKTVKESACESIGIIFIKDVNPNGTAFGGMVMASIDKIAALAATRHSRRVCVTASADKIDFIAPAFEGEALIMKASVNRVWNTSMEVGVKILSENLYTGEERHVASSYLTFVALDNDRKKVACAPVIPETRIEKHRYEEAEIRRKRRLEDREEKIRRRAAWAKELAEETKTGT